MAQEYSLKEIIRFAIEIEKEGALFYEKMSENSNLKETKDLFLTLKSDELVHMATFEKLLNDVGPDENEYVFHLENEYIAYLHNLIENTIFKKSDLDKVANELKTTDKVIDYAIGKEIDSINYYENMKKVLNKKYHKTLEKIIKEEHSHKERLEKIKK